SRLQELKMRLKERSAADAIYEYTAHWDEINNKCSETHLSHFCREVSMRLKARISAMLEHSGRQENVGSQTDALQEFVKERIRHFVGRSEAVRSIETYLLNRSPY